jgi:hypothetical protein
MITNVLDSHELPTTKMKCLKKTYGELPSSPMVCRRASIRRIRIASASAVVVNVMFIQRNNCGAVRKQKQKYGTAYQGHVCVS